MSGGNGSDGSSRDARSSYSNSIDSKDASKHLADDALFGSFYKSYRNTGVIEDSGIDNFLIDQIHVGSTNVDAISENLGSINIPKQRESNAAVSFDSIYSPYSTYFGTESGGLPHFEVPTNKNEPNSLTLNPFNPNNSLSLYYAESGGTLWTNSLADTGAVASGEAEKLNNPSGWLESGHTISWATHGTGQFYDLSFDDEFLNSKASGDKFSVEVENIRGVGLRSPMVVTGWGFDLNGNPVPADTGDNTKFASGAFSDISNWKSGPVDLRWDDERKVWAAGGGNTEIMKFTVDEVPPQIGQNATACEFVHTTVNDIGCSSSVNAIGDTGVKVYDDDLCFFNLPVTLLRGLKGTAERFVNPFADDDTDTDCILEAAAEGACRWVVTGLCCNEEIVTS